MKACQRIAALSEVERLFVVPSAGDETTALGAACLAGLATGYWPDAAALSARWQVDRRFEPAMSRDEAAARMAGWHDAIARVRSDRA